MTHGIIRLWDKSSHSVLTGLLYDGISNYEKSEKRCLCMGKAAALLLL